MYAVTKLEEMFFLLKMKLTVKTKSTIPEGKKK